MCVANSARSQMAEGLARTIAPKDVPIYSAGSFSSRLHPFALRVMDEIGIDISEHFSKTADSVPLEEVGTVITLCAEEVCPAIPGEVLRLHWPMENPDGPAHSDEEILELFRRIRDQIRDKLQEFFR